MSRTAIARANAAALDRGDDAAAVALLAEDVEVVLPGRSIRGRATWIELRAQRESPQHLEERVEGADFVETESGATMRGTLVQRWVETGEIANRQDLCVEFTIVDALITRLEMHAGS
jgi:ketosteroid isomerase-like protein